MSSHCPCQPPIHADTPERLDHPSAMRNHPSIDKPLIGVVTPIPERAHGTGCLSSPFAPLGRGVVRWGLPGFRSAPPRAVAVRRVAARAGAGCIPKGSTAGSVLGTGDWQLGTSRGLETSNFKLPPHPRLVTSSATSGGSCRRQEAGRGGVPRCQNCDALMPRRGNR